MCADSTLREALLRSRRREKHPRKKEGIVESISYKRTKRESNLYPSIRKHESKVRLAEPRCWTLSMRYVSKGNNQSHPDRRARRESINSWARKAINLRLTLAVQAIWLINRIKVVEEPPKILNSRLYKRSLRVMSLINHQRPVFLTRLWAIWTCWKII